MEYVQTVLFQVPASLMDQASRPGGLLPELDEHREFLRGLPGFRDMRVTRTINQEGNVLVVVQTRWTDDASLLRYETGEPNAGSIVRRHEGVILPESLQVLDMEALRTEASWAGAEAAAGEHARIVLPIAVPVGVLAFALLVIYGLSRIYLELSRDAGVALAAGVAVGILLVAAYVATHPRIPGWQIGGILAVSAAALIGGTIWAESQGGEAEGGEAVTGPTAAPGASPAASPGGAGAAITIEMLDNFFEPAEVKVTAGQTVTFDLPNKGVAIHNVHIASADGTYKEAFCKVGGAEPCSDPNTVPGGGTATLTWEVPDTPGAQFPFRCDFHQPTMAGTFTIQ